MTFMKAALCSLVSAFFVATWAYAACDDFQQGQCEGLKYGCSDSGSGCSPYSDPDEDVGSVNITLNAWYVCYSSQQYQYEQSYCSTDPDTTQTCETWDFYQDTGCTDYLYTTTEVGYGPCDASDNCGIEA